MLEKINLALRLITTAFDVEIKDLILSARHDLMLSGVLEIKAMSDVVKITADEDDTWESISELYEIPIEDLKVLNPNLIIIEDAVVYLEKPDSLILRAITLYIKSHFGLFNEDSEKYQKAYDSLKNHLCLSAEYTEV